MSSFVFIDSLKRDVYKYPDSADFQVEARQAETWNLIRSTSSSLPTTRSQNEYYEVKVINITLPVRDFLLDEPGIFLTITNSTDDNKINGPINHMKVLEESGFPCATGVRTLDEIAVKYYGTGATGCQLTEKQWKCARAEDQMKFWNSTRSTSSATFYLVFDRPQDVLEDGRDPVWLHYRTMMTQTLPLNMRGNNLRVTFRDVHGKKLSFTQAPGSCKGGTPCQKDYWDPCVLSSPVHHLGQVFIMLELTHIKN